MPAGTRSPFHRLQRFPVGSVQPDLMSVHDDRAVNKFPILHPVCRSAVFRQSIDRASVVADDPFHSERLFRPLRERGRVLRGQVELCEYAYDVDILPRMNAGDSRILRFGFLFATTKQERRGR